VSGEYSLQEKHEAAGGITASGLDAFRLAEPS
jgi:hypothetical protein